MLWCVLEDIAIIQGVREEGMDQLSGKSNYPVVIETKE